VPYIKKKDIKKARAELQEKEKYRQDSKTMGRIQPKRRTADIGRLYGKGKKKPGRKQPWGIRGGLEGTSPSAEVRLLITI